MTAQNYMVTFEESMKDEFNNAELQPKYERNDVTINGRDYCGGIMVFDLEFMKTYVYVYCTKVENVVYEFTFMTSNH